MDGVIPEVQEEGAVASRFDHVDRFIGESIRQIIPGLSEFQTGDISDLGITGVPFPCERVKESRGSTPKGSANIEIETLCLGVKSGGS